MNGDLVGRGWAFPAVISAAGGLALTSGHSSIDAAIRMTLSTAPGERVMRPDFGCGLWEHAFGPLDSSALGLMESAARQALARWEPRIDVLDVTATPDPDQGRVLIDICYAIRATNDERNLVYPFYVIPREESGP
jgi:phage baseplate assembly protein W